MQCLVSLICKFKFRFAFACIAYLIKLTLSYQPTHSLFILSQPLVSSVYITHLHLQIHPCILLVCHFILLLCEAFTFAALKGYACGRLLFTLISIIQVCSFKGSLLPAGCSPLANLRFAYGCHDKVFYLTCIIRCYACYFATRSESSLL